MSEKAIVYLTVNALKDKYPIKHLCQILNVSRSSYYDWTKHKSKPRNKENEELKSVIESVYAEHKGIYGYRRITIYINQNTDKHVNHKRVKRLMDELSLKAVIRRRRTRYIPCPSEYKRSNILNRDFVARAPYKKILTDMTEFKVKNGTKLYLSAMYDLFSKRIISFKISQTPNSILALETLKDILPFITDNGTILHTDRGGPYKTLEYKTLLREHGVIHSMSRVGRCIDNGPMEGFWGIIKSEMYYLKSFETKEELKKEIEEYIEFFNNKRIRLCMKA
ncbi:IS3 family transposase [Staphylococcus rostri]